MRGENILTAVAWVLGVKKPLLILLIRLVFHIGDRLIVSSKSERKPLINCAGFEGCAGFVQGFLRNPAQLKTLAHKGLKGVVQGVQGYSVYPSCVRVHACGCACVRVKSNIKNLAHPAQIRKYYLKTSGYHQFKPCTNPAQTLHSRLNPAQGLGVGL